MILSQSHKKNIKTTLLTSIFALLISACSTEDSTNTEGNAFLDIQEYIDTNTETNPGTEISGADNGSTVDPVTNPAAMYSYNVNLSDAQPLSGAVLEQTNVYMFFNNASQYSSMDFYCCKGIDGASTGETHKAAVLDSSAPFVYAVDLGQYSTSGTRELYVDRTRSDGSGIDNLYVNFSINSSAIPITPIPNTPAIISGVDRGSVTEDIDPDGDNLLEVTGMLNITDNDAGEAAFIARTHNGNYGRLTITTAGNWYYEANNTQSVIQNLAKGSTLTDTMTVSSVDGTTRAVRITINGADEANRAAVITGVDRGSVTEDIDPNGNNLLEVTGKLNITDSDPGEAAFIAKTVNGNYGNLLINATGNWSYAASNTQSAIQNLASGASLTDRLTVSSIDNTPHTVVITIIGADEANNAAIISGTDRGSVTEDIDPDGDNLLEVTGKLNITDNDAGEAAFIARTHNGNYGRLTITTAGNWYYEANNTQSVIQNLANGSTLTDTMTVSSVDGTTRAVRITINGADENNTTENVTLSWTAPSEREDNTSISLSEIAGYKVLYGTTQGNFTNTVIINDSTADGYTFKDFSPGTYYFVVTTIDTEGRESQYSAQVSLSL